MSYLHDRSIEIILAGQSANGAYVASPNFSQYKACWLRDGTWIAYSMDLVNRHDSARNFYKWADQTLRGYSAQVDALIAKRQRNQPLEEKDYLPTRFTLEGGLVAGHWTDYQLDGYGTWLWGVVEHIRITGDTNFYTEVRQTVVLLVRYLSTLWQDPNYDCWEEFRDQVHPATLAAIYGGLNAVAELDPSLETRPLAENIRQFAVQYGVADGRFMKFLGNQEVDSSLLWLAIPYGLVQKDDPIFEQTLQRIEQDLHRVEGGVYRYRADVYFGGGEWILLTAWLAWVYTERGHIQRATQLLHWIEAQAGTDGSLPEQVNTHLLAPDQYVPWVKKWGDVATPLLWSHAMYLILEAKLAILNRT